MADDLPELPEAIRRKLALQWEELKEERGFTGEHLNWPRTRRKQLGKGLPALGHALRPIYEPEERVGIGETINLAKERFRQLAEEYFGQWSAEKDGRCDWFAMWLQGIRALVVAEVAEVWSQRGGWFEHFCRADLDSGLAPLVTEWASKARKAEIQRLKGETAGSPVEFKYSQGFQIDPAYQRTMEEAYRAIERSRKVLERSTPSPEPSIPELLAELGRRNTERHAAPENVQAQPLSTKPLESQAEPAGRTLPAPTLPNDPASARTAPLFPKRAAWLKSEMAKRGNMTCYGLKKVGGPDQKTTKRILEGRPVRDDKLDLVARALSFQGARVLRADIPSD